ncbi:hypothetical protein JW752_00865 [Candidatus Peregrinibacteria bacterium]|nr:hypothetical protein [Candidatus Peregrinibacteria bacterium]
MKTKIENFDGESDYRERREELESDGYELITTYGFGNQDVYRLTLHAGKLEGDGKVQILHCERGYQIFLKRPAKAVATALLQKSTREQVASVDQAA